ncbi:MAG TPA: LLM class flavin-dependent oxidoreductase [Gaiellaceae bacterium]|nr:LLM class flavin-dependent oxidoreductase [Gaiellaceae bacterium]
MTGGSQPADVELFSTCPASRGFEPSDYLRAVEQVARWSNEAGYRGILIYTDNRLVDPWLVAQVILQATEPLCPLVAVQPLYMHPFTAAKKVATLAFLHGRRVYLNMLAGGFKNDLVALGDETSHDERYARTVEYTLILRQLLSSSGPVSFRGRYYRLENAVLEPPLPANLFPGLLISGSSEAGLAAARQIGATAVRYPSPSSEEQDRNGEAVGMGIRVGVIARETSEEAWAVARARFPEDRRGQIAHALAMRVSDSSWHKQLSRMADAPQNGPYWLHPFRNYKTFCPYLVGSYAEVGAELGRYWSLGFTTYILDVPVSPDDFHHTRLAFAAAAAPAPA